MDKKDEMNMLEDQLSSYKSLRGMLKEEKDSLNRRLHEIEYELAETEDKIDRKSKEITKKAGEEMNKGRRK